MRSPSQRDKHRCQTQVMSPLLLVSPAVLVKGKHQCPCMSASAVRRPPSLHLLQFFVEDFFGEGLLSPGQMQVPLSSWCP